MTISSEISSSGPYNGNGVTISFPYTFKVLNENHLSVFIYRSDQQTEELSLIDGDYSVSGVGSESFGNVTLRTAPLNGEMLTVVLKPPFTQETAFENSGPYLAKSVENRFDITVQQILSLKEGTDRAIKVDPGQAAPKISDIVAAQGYAEEVRDAVNEARQIVASTVRNALYFIGNGVTTIFATGIVGLDRRNSDVYIDGVYQQKKSYLVEADGDVVFSEAPPGNGIVENIEVVLGATTAQAFAIPSLGSVTPDRLVSDFDDNWVTRLFATGSYRSQRARFDDTVDIREFEFNLSGAVGTEAWNNAAWDRLIAHASENPDRVFTARKGDVLRWSAGGKTIPRARLRFEDMRMHWVGDSSGTGAAVLTAANGTDIDAIRFEVPAGGNFRRFFDVAGDSKISALSLECENQINNEAGSLLDRALRFRGHRNRIGPVRTKNVDNCAIMYGDGGAGFPQIDSVYESFTFENFSKGGVGRNLTRCAMLFSKASGKSANALPNPGYNAWEWEGLVECTLGPRQLFDSAEHNERFGGVHSGEQLTRDCQVGPLLSGRAGQCGLKGWSGSNLDTITGMTFGDIEIFDCGMYAQMGNTAPPQFNDFGVMMQNLSKSTFGRINGYAKDATYAALDIAYFSQCEDVTAEVVNGKNPFRNLLRVSEFNGNNTDSNPTSSFHVGRVVGSGHLAEGIYLQVPTNSFRDVNVDDFSIIGGTDPVRWEGAAARAVQPCYFRGAARAFSGTKFNVPGTANIKTVDKFA